MKALYTFQDIRASDTHTYTHTRTFAQQTNPRDVYSGGRALAAVIRPYLFRTAGKPLKMHFDVKTRLFEAEFEIDSSIKAPTQVFVPLFQVCVCVSQLVLCAKSSRKPVCVPSTCMKISDNQSWDAGSSCCVAGQNRVLRWLQVYMYIQ